MSAPRAAAVGPAVDRPAPTLTVLVCAYTLDRWDDITAAVDSLRRQTSRPDQVVLVSDHNDELLERARAAFPEVLCVASDGPQGLSGARNTGVQRATGDVVAFLDDDASADEHWAQRLLAAYTDAAVLGVGGGVLPAWRAPRPAWFPDEFLWVVGCSYRGLPRERAEVRNPIGANMSFRREVFEAAGGFTVSIGRLGSDAAGCEETEFAIRARRLHPGGRVLVEPQALCRHTVTPERVTRRYFRLRCRAEGLSKAAVSELAGADAALAAERRYVTRTLPVGVARGLRDVLRGDPAGAARAWAIVEGTALTASGYLLGRLRQRRVGSTGRR
ncbi:glycosyltransferase family 2 protein [Blastococcus xanthinilyticus]|uniref:GT2 family glycosyltransferase n=1 Tax=Blastococcus xanthinilyticus TaxID=1564164 RepID=A0A5S5CTU5_9ACTN|nr:glycosyltransferase family 2 protein [Blastococcus xanthinilyticus]TYP87207.1 GT2 family glycosyltransferase [Blastococcus xanthinilyticus]